MDGFEIVDPVFKTYVLGNAPLEKLGDGFRWTEGPVWFGDMGTLIFSDLPNDRVMRWSEADGVQLLAQALAFRQRTRARPRRPARHLLAPPPQHHPARARRHGHGAVRSLRGQAAERAE